jgi:uncharacterized membrane protein YkgB
MIISFLEETIAAAIIGFIVERIIRKTLSYMYKENNEDNLHLEYRPQNTQEEIVIIAEREHNKVFKFSNYI